MATVFTSRAFSSAVSYQSRASITTGRVTKSHPKATKSCASHQEKPHNHDTSECKQVVSGVLHYVVIMASCKLLPSEMAYPTTEHELLAIFYMLIKYHKWLFGIEFELHSDHR